MRMRSSWTWLTVATAILAAPVFAGGDDADIRALKHEIEALQARVAALEARHTFAAFMPNFAERFHVMHRAGEAGDWAVAAHELAEMKRLTELSTSIDPEKGALMQSMLGPSLNALGEEIEHGEEEEFQDTLAQTIEVCNACHAATGSDFIQVTLDAVESLSMRHPHRFMHRGVPGGHTHEHGHMMEPSAEEAPDHDHDED